MATVVNAEDDPDLAELISICLAVRGHEVVTVTDAQSALRRCRAERPDLVIMDTVMPGPLDGLQAVRRIRSDPALAGLPVIVLSAQAAQADIAAGLRAGADVYMTKPFSPRDLAAHVAALLDVRRLERAPRDAGLAGVRGKGADATLPPSAWTRGRLASDVVRARPGS